MSINNVNISGNLTRDCEAKALPSGQSVAEFTVAVNGRAKNAQTGAWEDRPNYVDCTIFGNRATALAPRLAKGTKVAVTGELRQDTWKDKTTGANRSKLRVIVAEIDLLGGQPKDAAPSSPAGRQPEEWDDDEIPFP